MATMTLVERVARELCRYSHGLKTLSNGFWMDVLLPDERARERREAKRIIKMVREEKHDSKLLEDEWATELIEKRMAALERAREERATHARVIESWKREEEGWNEREKVLVEALKDCASLLELIEPEVRGGYSPDEALAKARAALAGKEASRE